MRAWSLCILCLFVCPAVLADALLVSERARGLVQRVEPGRRLALSGDVFRTLSTRDEPQGIAAAVALDQVDLPQRHLGVQRGRRQAADHFAQGLLVPRRRQGIAPQVRQTQSIPRVLYRLPCL